MPGLKFRVLLDSEKKEEVFRDILIADTDNFESFYKIILDSFDFKGDQMGSFYVSNDMWDKGHEISLMDMTYDDDALRNQDKAKLEFKELEELYLLQNLEFLYQNKLNNLLVVEKEEIALACS